MALFKSLLGRDELSELPEDLKKLVEKARREKKALGEAVRKTEAAVQNFEKITAPLEETKAAIADIRGQVAEMQQGDAIKEAVTRIASLEERAQDLTRSHDQTAHSLAENLHDLLESRRTWLDDLPREDVGTHDRHAGLRPNPRDGGLPRSDVACETYCKQEGAFLSNGDRRGQGVRETHQEAASNRYTRARYFAVKPMVL